MITIDDLTELEEKWFRQDMVTAFPGLREVVTYHTHPLIERLIEGGTVSTVEWRIALRRIERDARRAMED